jgi:hypothetical protein
MERIEAVQAARLIVAERYPECDTALLAGSVVRGQATKTSDLDLVVVTARSDAPFRESFLAYNWPVEVFVHTRTSLTRFFASDAQSRIPSLPFMCAEGVVVNDSSGLAAEIKAEAQAALDQGPELLTAREIEATRYALTDRLDDFLGNVVPGDGIIIAADLAMLSAEFVLAYHRRWSGRGKWLVRALRRFDPERAAWMCRALEAYCRDGTKEELVAFAEAALAPAGGRLFGGHRRGAPLGWDRNRE